MSSNLHVSTHPLVLSKLTQLRLHDLPAKDFREGIKEIGGMLLFEASASLPVGDVPDLESPIASFTGKTIPLRIGFSPILRSGLGMVDGELAEIENTAFELTLAALSFFPDATVLHLGLFRDKATLQAIEYYSKLPSEVTADIVFVLDPLIATGGTAIAALGMLVDWGLKPEQIKVVSVLGSQQGVDKVLKEYPGVEIFIGGVDDQLTDKGYISPGLGDAVSLSAVFQGGA